jgi:hypothetical protein
MHIPPDHLPFLGSMLSEDYEVSNGILDAEELCIPAALQ